MIVGGDGDGNGYSVVMPALQSTASTFDSEAKKLAGLVPAGGPPVPDGGNGAIDGAMHSVVSKIAGLDQALSKAMALHGKKLNAAYTNYSRTETVNAQLSQDVLTSLLPNSCPAPGAG